jgi:hypothetical protein
MIEGVGTITNANQGNTQAVDPQAQPQVEAAADVAKGKVNPADDVEDSSNESASNQQAGKQDVPTSGSGEERIVDLLG